MRNSQSDSSEQNLPKADHRGIEQEDAERRFRARATSGSREEGLALLDKLNAVFGGRKA